MHNVLDIIGKEWVIRKAWANEDGTINVEGWVSTNTRDIERDVIEPESFAGETLQGYFDRGAPISSEHNTHALPVGYMLKSILVRDGTPFQEVNNSRYPEANFRHFDGTGTGWYGLGVIDDEIATVAVAKGKISSFSWIGQPKSWAPLPGGGRHFQAAGAINPLLEATITAYPVNATAIMRVAKARGYLLAEPPPPPSPRPRLVLTPAGVERILSPKE